MTGIVNNTGARSGVIGTTVGTPSGGITHAQQFRVECGWTGSETSGAQRIENWEENDTDGYARISDGTTAVTLENHVFTFNVTGTYFITFTLAHQNNGGSLGGDNVDARIRYTTDWDGSSGTFGDLSISRFGGDAEVNYNNIVTNAIYKVTDDDGTVGVEFLESLDNSAKTSRDFGGDSAINYTTTVFIRLGD